MTVKYADGRVKNGLLIAWENRKMRVVLEGADDTEELISVCDAWISDSGDPVKVQFEWQHHAVQQTVTEADCVCSKELAASLIDCLFGGNQLAMDHTLSESAHASNVIWNRSPLPETTSLPN